MYSESDLASAVDAGALSPASANALRNYVAERRSAPAVDEEHFKLLTGFNDIFVAIAAALILVAAARIGAYFGVMVIGLGPEEREVGGNMIGGGIAVAASSWLLAEYFTAKRRMALPSILLMLGFVGGVAATLSGIFAANIPWIEEQMHLATELQRQQLGGGVAAAVGVLTAIATWIHWKRFMVPITVAAGAMVIVGAAVGVLLALLPQARDWVNEMLLVAGVAMFFFAMRWDMSDLERRTRRSDVAFWLHLAAAPLIAHPVFHMLGVFDGVVTGPIAAVVIALYIVFAFVALAVDRRALLVSSLIYVLWAMYALFQATGAVELAAALTALVIGSALLLLSAFWQPVRRMVVGLLGGLEERLPPTQLITA
jgi:pimeloyl-ACP methyl ester carboxylesterase